MVEQQTRAVNSIRIVLFVLLAAGTVLLFVVLGQYSSRSVTPDLFSTPTPTELHWPDTLRGTLAAPTSVARATSTSLPRDLKLAACAPPIDHPVTLPANFPAFPFPSGIEYFKSTSLDNNPNYLIVAGYAPLGIDDSVRYLLGELSQSGYELGNGDSEPGEAEAAFVGAEWRGGFRIASVWDCASASEWTVVVIKR